MTHYVVNWDEFADNFDKDKFAMSLVVEAFLSAAAESMDTLRTALAAKDQKAVAMAAHSLKGAILNFGAAEAVRLSQALENLGYSGLTDEAVPLFQDLEKAMSVLLNELVTESARYQEAV